MCYSDLSDPLLHACMQGLPSIFSAVRGTKHPSLNSSLSWTESYTRLLRMISSAHTVRQMKGCLLNWMARKLFTLKHKPGLKPACAKKEEVCKRSVTVGTADSAANMVS